MATDYTQLMEELRNGTRETFEVTPDDFMAFHQAYEDYEFRSGLIGEAQLNGHVIYHFDNNGKATS